MKVKYSTYKILTPLLKVMLPFNFVKRRSEKLINKYNIKYLDIGGAVPVEGYYVIHLSSVELYGIPRMRTKALRFKFNFQTNDFEKEYKSVNKACTLNYDLLNGIPLADNSVEGINMSHFLEHFSRNDGFEILKECLRVLQPKGILRISCPDLSKYAAAYSNKDKVFFEKIKKMNFINDEYQELESFGDLLINKAYDGSNGHKWFYDVDSTIRLAQKAGFNNGSEKKSHQSTLPEIEIIEPSYRDLESFYLEVYK